MSRHFKITVLLCAALGLSGSSLLLAEEPGGKSIGAGFEKVIKVRKQTIVPLFECHKCYVPACLTVQVRNDPDFFSVQPISTNGGGPFIGFVKKETTRTVCMSRIVEFMASCGGKQDCEVHYRVDMIGDAVVIPQDNEQ